MEQPKEPEYKADLKFMAMYLDQLDDWLVNTYGFSLWERMPELWDDYEEEQDND